MDSVIVTGSMGCLGTEISEYLRSKDYKVIECDLQLGHDLTDETFVQNFFQVLVSEILFDFSYLKN